MYNVIHNYTYMKTAPDRHAELESALQELGVANLDAQLYLHLLKKGGSSVAALARRLKVERPTIYAAIERLQALALVPSGKVPYSRLVTAESPRRVLALLEQRRTTLSEQHLRVEDALPNLLAEFSARTPKSALQVFEGKDQFLTVFEEVLQEAEERILFLGDAQSFIDLEGMEYERAWIKKRVQKKIVFTMLVFKNATTISFQNTDTQELRETRFLPDTMKFTSSFMVYGSKVLLWSPVATRAIVIEDTTIAPMFRQLFLQLWERD